MKIKKSELTVFEMVYSTNDDIDAVQEHFPEDFSCIFMNYHVEYEKSGDSITFRLPEKELSEKQVRSFISVFWKEFSKVSKGSSDTFEFNFKSEYGLLRTIKIPFKKSIVIKRPNYVICPIKNSAQVCFERCGSKLKQSLHLPP